VGQINFLEGQIMKFKSKQHIVEAAHQNPEYAAMSARKLATIINVSQPVISSWRRRNRLSVVAQANPVAAEKHGITKKGRILQKKVTVSSVRRKWEEKYMALSRQYDYLADRLIEMAKNADNHRNMENGLICDLSTLQQKFDDALASIEHYRQLLEQERMSWYKKLFSSKQ